jgi:membrane protein
MEIPNRCTAAEGRSDAGGRFSLAVNAPTTGTGMALTSPSNNAGSAEVSARKNVRLREVLAEALPRFFQEDSFNTAASVAFYSVLSLFPFLLLLLELSGFYIHHRQWEGRLAVILERALPMDPRFILENLQGVSHAYGRVGLASFLLLLWSSSGVFMPLEKSMNRAWLVERERSWVGRRSLALGMSLLLGLLVLASSGLAGISIYIGTAMLHWERNVGNALIGLLYRLLLGLVSLVMSVLFFAILFWQLPNCPMKFRQALPSAAFTALLWQLARVMFTFFLLRLNYRHIYGSIGAMVAFMTWAYISSAVLLFGAQISGRLYQSVAARHPSLATPG